MRQVARRGKVYAAHSAGGMGKLFVSLPFPPSWRDRALCESQRRAKAFPGPQRRSHSSSESDSIDLALSLELPGHPCPPSGWRDVCKGMTGRGFQEQGENEPSPH